MVVKATLRVDNRDDDTKSRLQSFLSRYEKYLVYEEVSDKQKKLHYQGVIYVNSDKEYNAMKVRFSTHFKDWEKGSKSMSLVKKDTYEVYITKDGKQVFNQGFSDEEVENLQKLSYKKDGSKSSGIKYTFLQTVEFRFDDWIKERHDKAESEGKKVLKPDRYEISRWLVDEFACMKKLWDVGIITKYTNYFEYKLFPEFHANVISKQASDKY